MKKRMQPHIMCGVGDIEKYVLLPGDPKRVEKIAGFSMRLIRLLITGVF